MPPPARPLARNLGSVHLACRAVLLRLRTSACTDMPDRAAAHHHAAFGQLRLQGPQSQRRMPGQPRQRRAPPRRHHVAPPPAHRPGRGTPGCPVALSPRHLRRDADPEHIRRMPHRLPGQDEQRHPLPQVIRSGRHHPSRTSASGQKGQSQTPPDEDPPRSSHTRSRSMPRRQRLHASDGQDIRFEGCPSLPLWVPPRPGYRSA